MDPLTGVIIAGAVMEGYGTLTANAEEAKAHRANAAHAAKIAEYNQLVGDREEELFREELQGTMTGQEIAYTKAGVDMSGSALVQMADTMSRGQEQIDDIRLKTKMNVEEALFQKEQHEKAADVASDPFNNFVQLASIGANTYAKTGGGA